MDFVENLEAFIHQSSEDNLYVNLLSNSRRKRVYIKGFSQGHLRNGCCVVPFMFMHICVF